LCLQQGVIRDLRTLIKQLWSATEFSREDVTSYARGLILPDTRVALVVMAVLLLCLQIGIWLLQIKMGHGQQYFYTFCLLSLLSGHVLISSWFVKETRVLHLLAMAYLVMSGTAITLVAHQMGTFNIALLSSSVLLIVVIPLMPWGLKEAIGISLLIYGLFTASTLSVAGRFESQTIWTLQFLFFASILIALALVARNVGVRKHDIETRFDLEQAQREQEKLSLTDPLTGVWNRRFLTRNFLDIVEDARAQNHKLQIALLDLDDFKLLNDSRGHHSGDEILKGLADVLRENLPGNAHVIRLGGDEFAVLYAGEDFETQVCQCLKHLETDPKLIRAAGGMPVRVSVGFAGLDADQKPILEDLYRSADQRLYEAKRARPEDRTTSMPGPKAGDAV
jgi:diguanylate cyclase (GGDEF)-like protein